MWRISLIQLPDFVEDVVEQVDDDDSDHAYHDDDSKVVHILIGIDGPI